MLWLLEWFRTPSGFHYDSSCRSRQGFTGFRLKFRGYGSFPSTQRNTGRFWPKLGGVTCLWHGAQARNYSLGQVCLASHKMDLDLNDHTCGYLGLLNFTSGPKTSPTKWIM